MDKKTIIITGATSGIGLHCVEQFADINTRIIAIGRNISTIDTNLCGVTPFTMDLSKSSEIDKFICYLKSNGITVSGFVHCAGIAPITRIGQFEYATLESAFMVNTFSFIYMLSELEKYSLLDQGGAIVALSSIVAEYPNFSQCVYGSSKVALNYIVRNYAKIFFKKNIRVNALELGCADTPMYRKLNQFDEQLSKYTFGAINIDCIANEIRRLLSDETKFTTGSIIRIDSGFLSNK